MLYPNYIVFLEGGGGGPKTGVSHEIVLRIFQICGFWALDTAPTLDVPVLFFTALDTII